MLMDIDWFQTGPIPANIIQGTYTLKLVFLSYVIAVLASFVALDFVGRLRAEKNKKIQVYWLCGGAFVMGSGIWSMHFIGMLAFNMPMPMEYELFWTILSLVIAVAASGLALYILRASGRSLAYIASTGLFIGLAIATMHYMGMEGMRAHVDIHYQPGLFFLSVVIAIAAAEAALWLALESNKGSSRKQLIFKTVSAIVMGVAICGMHYTGVAAAVFTPVAHINSLGEAVLQPTLLAFFIAGINLLIISLALTVSTYYKKIFIVVQNEQEFLNAVLNNLQDGIIACDAKGSITVFNHALQKYLVAPSALSASNGLSDYLELFVALDEPPLPKDDTPLMHALKGNTISAMELLVKQLFPPLKKIQ